MFILAGQFLHRSTINAFEEWIGPLGLFHTNTGSILGTRKIHYGIMAVKNDDVETWHK